MYWKRRLTYVKVELNHDNFSTFNHHTKQHPPPKCFTKGLVLHHLLGFSTSLLGSQVIQTKILAEALKITHDAVVQLFSTVCIKVAGEFPLSSVCCCETSSLRVLKMSRIF